MKRVLSVILAVVLLLTMFPQTALFARAEGTTPGTYSDDATRTPGQTVREPVSSGTEAVETDYPIETDGPFGDTYYEKVTSLDDLPATFIIVNEVSSKAFSGPDAVNNNVEVIIDDGIIADANGAAFIEIDAIDGGYSLKILNGDKAGSYIYGTEGKNFINYGETAVASTISFTDGVARIENNSTYFCFNATSGQDRFRFYKSTTTGNTYIIPALYREVSDEAPCAHANTEERAEVPATCTAPGNAAGTYCNDCGRFISGGSAIEALGHDYAVDHTTAPTCTEAGLDTYTCSRCTDSYTKEVPETGHNYVDGSCVNVNNGAVCGTVEPEKEDYSLVDSLADGDEVILYNPANGVAVKNRVLGTNWYLATAAAAPVEGVISTYDASIVWKVSVDAETGKYTFSNGDRKLVAWLSNSYIEIANDPAIEGADAAWTVTDASVDDHTHLLGSAVKLNAYLEVYTKSVEGVSQLVVCGYTSSAAASSDSFGFQFYVRDAEPTHSHVWDDGVQTTAPTCTEAGVMTYSCTVDGCEASYTEAIPALGHIDENSDNICDRCEIGLETYTLSTTAPAAGYDYIIVAEYEGRYYALDNFETDGYVTTCTEVFPTNDIILCTGDYTFTAVTATDTAVEPNEGVAFIPAGISGDEPVKYMHLNSGKIRVAIYAQNGVFNFAAGEADNTFTMTALQNGMCLSFNGTKFISSADAVSDLYFYAKETPKPHEHAYAWDGNVGTDGNHTLVCECGESVPEDCTDAEPVIVLATCIAYGTATYICDICGYTWTEIGDEYGAHNYVNGECTVCHEKQPGLGSFVKVTKAPADWSGKYLIVWETGEGTANVFNGESAQKSYATGTIVEDTIARAEDMAIVTIAAMEGGYSLYVDGKGYMKGTEGTNALSYDNEAPQLNTIELAEDGVLITSNTSVLRWNNISSTGILFRYYKAASYTGQQPIQLYKLKETPVSCKHDWDDGVVTAAPTCVGEGVMTFTCVKCGETRTEETPALGHQDNNADGICDVCGAIDGTHYEKVTEIGELPARFLVVNEAAGRAFNGLDAANGYVEVAISNGIICDPNGAAIIEIAEIPDGYSLKIINGDKAGYYIYGRTGYNSVQYGFTPVANTITFADGAATISSNDTSLRYNSISGNDRFRFYKITTTGASFIVPALYREVTASLTCQHTDVSLAGFEEATCTAPGFTGNYVCSDCGQIITPGSKIAALGHDFVDGICTRCSDASPEMTIATSLVSLNGNGSDYVNRNGETNLGDLVADALVWYATEHGITEAFPADRVVAIQNGGGLRAGIKIGAVTRQDITTVLPLGNTIAVIYLTGAELLETLEAATYLVPSAHGAFPQVSGIRFAVDTSMAYDAADTTYPNSSCYPPASINRVHIEEINGKEFDPDETYAVIANDYLMEGGDTYGAFAAARSVAVKIPLDYVVAQYISYGLDGIIDEPYSAPLGRIIIENGYTPPACKHANTTDTEAVAVSCTEPGYTAGIYCNDCESYISGHEYIVPIGHDFVCENTVLPTCTEIGYDTYTCSRCTETKTETAPALGHDIITEPAVPATCTKPGLTEGQSCTRCDYSVTQQTVSALGHDIVADKEKAPTCVNTGLTAGEHCTRCDYRIVQETVPALGHDYVTVVTPPTYLAGGSTAEVCSRCGDTKILEETDPLPRTPLSEATLTPEYTAAYYQGEPLRPEIYLEYEGEQYDAAEELEITYADNNKVGTATVTVTGINKFEGTQTLTFEISYETIPETIINVRAVGEIGKISVSWAVSAEVTTDKYNIYRKAEGEESFTKIRTVSGRNTLSYTDTAVTEGTVYEYYVTGIGLYGAESEPSQTVSAQTATDKEAPVISKFTPASETRISAVTKLAVTVSDNIGVTEVTYSTSPDRETWTEQGSAAKSPFSFNLDTTTLNDGIVYVRAVAYDAAGNDSAPMVRTYMVDNTPPARVTGLATSALYSSRLTLVWEDVADVDRASYVVQKLTDGTYVNYATVTTVGCNVSGLSPATEYTFRVACKDTCGNQSEWSKPFAVTTPADETAPVVTKLSPAPKRLNGSLSFSATAKDECGIAAITIQASTDLTEWTDLSTKTYSALQESRTYSYTVDMSRYAEGSIYLRAVAADGSGNRSDESARAPFTEYIIDRTAPAVPTGVAALGQNGYITVSWTQGTEPDLGTYSVYRASSEDGEYSKLASGLSSLNYHDRGVQTDVLYFYKVTVCDTCGNVSDRSAAVSAKTSEDNEAPEILSISSSSGQYISDTYHTVSALASDNSRLQTLVIEYKTAPTAEYTKLAVAENIGDYSKKLSATVPMTGLSDGDTVYIRAYAVDTAGLISEEKTAQFTVDGSAPAADHLTAELNGTTCTLSWNGCGEADLSGYKVYRSTDGGAYNSLGSRAVKASGQYTFIDYVSGSAEHTYTYKLVPTDIRGNTSEYTVQVTYTPPTEEERVNSAPTAVADVPVYMEKGVEEYFDATGSTDDRMVVAYLWDFGDGTTSDAARTVKKYTESGSYTVTLTVTDDEGATATVFYTVEVKERNELGVLNVKVVDDNNRPVSNAMVVIDQNAADALYTDANGTVSVTLPTGDYEIGAMLDIHHLPAKKTVTVLSNATRTVTLMLVEEELVTGDFEITRMTLQEIRDANISVYSSENQNVYKVKVQVTYGSKPLTINYIRNDTSVLSIKITDSNGKPVETVQNSNGEARIWTPTVLSFGGTADADIVAILDVPAQASFLKEFFDVKLHITNHASRDFDLTDNEITLNVPEGLTVMRGLTGYESGNKVNLEKLEGQQTVTLNWCLRGEVEGEYDISADYSGNLEYFDRIVSTTFRTEEPIKVYGMSGIELNVNVCDTLRNGAFYFSIGLENQRPVDLYLPNISLYDKVENVTESVCNSNPDGNFYIEPFLLNTYLETGESRQYLPIVYDKNNMPIPQIETLAPGQKLVYEYVCYNAVSTDTVGYFQSAIVKECSGLADQVTVSSYDFPQYSYEDYSEKLDLILENKSSPRSPRKDIYDAYDYIMFDSNYYYYKQSLDMDRNLWNAIYTVADTVLALDFGNITMEDQEKVIKQVLLGILTDKSVVDAIEEETVLKYFDIIDGVLSKLKTTMIQDRDGIEYGSSILGPSPILSSMSDDDIASLVKLTVKDTSNVVNKMMYKGSDAAMKEIASLVAARLIGMGIETTAEKIYDRYHMEKTIDYSDYLDGVEFMTELVSSGFSATQKVLWDEFAYNCLRSKANVEYSHFVLDNIIAYCDRYSAVYGDRLKEVAIEFKNAIDESYASSLAELDYLAGTFFGSVTTDLAEKAVGEALKTLIGTAYGYVTLGWKVIDNIFNLDAKKTEQDTMQIYATISDTIRGSFNSYVSGNRTKENDLFGYSLLASFCNLRLDSEKAFIEFVDGWTGDGLVKISEAKALEIINDLVGSDFTSLEAWRDAVCTNIISARDILFNIELIDAPDTPAAPTVRLDYETNRTAERFSADYEYCFSDGVWIRCTGEPIAFTPKRTQTVLRVRKAAAENSLAGNITTVFIYAQKELSKLITVKFDDCSYFIDNLTAGRDYQILLLEDAEEELDWSRAVTFTAQDGQTVVSPASGYDRVALRSCVDAAYGETYSVPLLRSVATRSELPLTVTGNGSVAQSRLDGCYFDGETVSMTAVPNPGQELEGWYVDGVKVGSDAVYLFETGTAETIEARFTGAKPDRMVITSLPDKLIYTDGEALDMTGFVLKVYYSDGYEAVIENYTASIDRIRTKRSVNASGAQIVVRYADMSVIIPITMIHGDGIWRTTAAATCTGEGTRCLYCENCGELLRTKAVSPTGHLYEDGACIYCGEPEPIYNETLKIKGATLSLRSDIGIYFMVQDSVLEQLEDPYMVFTKALYDEAGEICGTKTSAVFEYAPTTVMDGVDGYEFYFNGINAAEMGSNITATLCGKKNGVPYKGKTVDYSVLTYANNLLRKSSDTKLHSLLVDMLNYGAAAQTYAGYNTENLVNNGLTAEQRALGTAGDPAPATCKELIHNEGASVLITGCCLVLHEKVSMRYSLDLSEYAGDVRDLYAAVSYTDTDGVKKTVTIDSFDFDYQQNANGSYRYVVSFDTLNAAQMRTKCTIEIFSKLTGERISDTAIYSIESYVNSMLHSEDIALAELVSAMMKYGNTTENYFLG